MAEQNKSGVMYTSCVEQGASTADLLQPGGSLTAVLLETEQKDQVPPVSAVTAEG